MSQMSIRGLLAIFYKQATSAPEWALCQLTVCFEFQSRSESRKGNKSCALQMVFRTKLQG